MAKRKREIIVTDTRNGDSKRILVSDFEYGKLFRAGVQANNISVPVHMRVAHVFKAEVLRYFDILDEGSAKSTALLTAFDFGVENQYMRGFVYAVATGLLKEKDLHFNKMWEKASSLYQDNSAGNTLSNQDLNNDFYSWKGSEKLREYMELRVAAVRFLQFVWHLFWDEEFQKVLRSF